VKTFIHHDIPRLERVDSERGRTYLTPTGNKYPSVTSVVGLHSAQHIQAWRDRVGHAEADKITKRASKRGTAIHALAEQFLLGENVQASMFDVEMWSSIKPHVDKIDNIHCLETQLFSHKLQVAGTVDCIGEYDGKMSVIDFKSSSKVKTRDMIHNYFMQTACYSFMFWELTGIAVPDLVIIMGVDEGGPLIFKERSADWIKPFKALRADYKAYKGI
jgi:ATP-dependent exoDNAse (exonuclease V) beta subunit